MRVDTANPAGPDAGRNPQGEDNSRVPFHYGQRGEKTAGARGRVVQLVPEVRYYARFRRRLDTRFPKFHRASAFAASGAGGSRSSHPNTGVIPLRAPPATASSSA